MIAAFRNGVRVDGFALDSRAAHYGDGAFTTLRIHAGSVCWWDLHLARLQQACAELHLQPPDWAALALLLEREAARAVQALAKVMLVPVPQGRGYGRVWPSPVDVMVMIYPPAAVAEAAYREGVVLEVGESSIDAARGHGTKSLSREAQVLAAPERVDGEVLMCGRDGFVACARSANLFAQFGNVLATPPAGIGVIAGVARARLLQSPPAGFSVRVQAMHRDALRHADALILSNAVRGFVPVRRFGDRLFTRRDAIAAIMHTLHLSTGLPES
jgi:4-amino-4-deoxychorismate lyase